MCTNFRMLAYSNCISRKREQMVQRKIYKEAMTTNSPNAVNGINLQIREVRWNPNRINSKKTTPKKSQSKCLGEKKKPKWKIFKSVREKETFRYREEMISVTTDFLSKISEGRRQLNNILCKREKEILKTANLWYFPGGPVARIWCLQYRGSCFDSWSGNQIPHATTKTPQRSQRNR